MGSNILIAGAPPASLPPASLTGRKLLEHICRCPTLPSVPAVVAEVLEATGRPDADLSKISLLLAKDPVLVALVLRTVNSSYYALQQRLTSVAQALPVLGIKNLRMLIAGHGVLPAMKKCGPEKPLQLACCRRSLYSATAARMLAERVSAEAPDSYFLSALLMDIGVLAMAQAIGPVYGQILKACQRHADLEPVEREKFGFSHALVGAVLARQWKLPEELALPIQFHHDPSGAPARGSAQKMARLICLAGFCADVFLDHNPLWPISEAYRIAADDFGLEKVAMDQLMEGLAVETQKLGAAFDVQMDQSATLARAHERITDELTQGVLDLSDAGEEADRAMPATGRQDAGSAGGGPSGGPQQRREARAPRAGAVTVFPCTDVAVGRSIKAGLRDVSPSGIGLRLTEPLEVGSRFILGLRRDGAKATVIMYQVRHRRLLEGEGKGTEFAIGAELVRVLREKALSLEGGADTPMHRIGRVLLRSAEGSVGYAVNGATVVAKSRDATSDEGGMNDPGSVSC